MVRLSKKYPGEVFSSSAEILEAYKTGDLLAEATVQNALHVTALAVVNIGILLNPSMFVFGGGVVADGWFVERLRKEVEAICSDQDVFWTADLRVSPLGADKVGVLGAACIALNSIGDVRHHVV
jgi:predicted NBD/HSP70 family sugar kinase